MPSRFPKDRPPTSSNIPVSAPAPARRNRNRNRNRIGSLAPAFLAATLAGSVLGCSLPRVAEYRETALALPASKDGPLAALAAAAANARAANPDDKSAEALLIGPRRCNLNFLTLFGSLDDSRLNDALWEIVDEQVLDASLRARLNKNGLRVGKLTGALPPEIESRLNEDKSRRPDLAKLVNIPDGDHTELDMVKAPAATVFLNRNGMTQGREYQSARGLFRLAAMHSGARGVSVSLIPRIDHGDRVQRVVPDSNPDPFAPQGLMFQSRQAEELFRDLAVELVLYPEDVLVIAALPNRAGSLGSFLLHDRDANDEPRQRVLLLTAQRADLSGAADPLSALPLDPREDLESFAGPDPEAAAASMAVRRIADWWPRRKSLNPPVLGRAEPPAPAQPGPLDLETADRSDADAEAAAHPRFHVEAPRDDDVVHAAPAPH